MTRRERHFEVHPSVVFKLGADLITDDIQAIAELIKNSYDADATQVIVRIDTQTTDESGDVGSVEIVDNGFGMTPATLESGWLTISNSAKREMKARGGTTDRGRTPLGDKGLGRLGAQRLGDRIDIVTSTGDGASHQMTFDWRDFSGRTSLSEVPVAINSLRDGRRTSGTAITISGLRDPDALRDRNRLQSELSRTISPYREIEQFRLLVTVDAEEIDLSAIDRQVRNASTIRYQFAFDGVSMKVSGRVRLAQLRPNSKADRLLWSKIAEEDEGTGLFSYLNDLPEASVWKLRRSRAAKWWIDFAFSVELSDVRPALDPSGSPAAPGPFSGEIDSFNLSVGSVDAVGIFDRAKDLRELLKDLHGIRIYRDGFNVRAPEDWLGLGKQITSGGSWYTLRPATTMGYVAITASHNGQLTETTDREGFVQTPAYLNFERLLRDFVQQSARALEFIGRGAVDFRRQFDLEPNTETRSPDALLQQLTASLAQAEGYAAPMKQLAHELIATASEADGVLARYADNSAGQVREREIMETMNRLSRQAARASEFVADLEVFVAQLGDQQRTAARLKFDLENLSSQLDQTYETMAVGLTAEALAHEIGNIAERLARRSTQMRRLIRQRYPGDTRLIGYVEQVQGVVAGLRRQLAHLSPALRYVRERREDITMSVMVEEIAAYYADRWDGGITLDRSVPDDFVVTMNRGKLLQIVDNVILNSEYWLLEQVRLGELTRPTVSIEVAAPFLRITDNGPGIDVQVEDALFEPFVSKKPSGLGRGLGLFIVRQLLDAEGCEISLLPERNKRGRKFGFEIDFSSVTDDD